MALDFTKVGKCKGAPPATKVKKPKKIKPKPQVSMIEQTD